jgi:hypothetical protein
MWLQSMAGIGYLFGAISPVVKDALGYNQRQVAALGIAKDLGDCVGFLAGSLSAMLPPWGMLLIGAVQNFIGYGWLWLIVTKQAPALPLSMVHLLLPFVLFFDSIVRSLEALIWFKSTCQRYCSWSSTLNPHEMCYTISLFTDSPSCQFVQ